MGRNAYPRVRGPCHDAGMSGTDPEPTSPISYDSSRTFRAEDDISGGGGSRVLARVLTPFLAVIPWVITMAGLAVISEWQVRFAQRFQTDWGILLGAVAVFVVAALLWGALTAWSSVGTVLAGALTVVLGLVIAAPEASRHVFDLLMDLPGDSRRVYFIVTPTNFLLFGTLLIAAGLGASGARRVRR